MTTPDDKHKANKVGILPWRISRKGPAEPVIEFLVHQPRPKEDPANPGRGMNGQLLGEEAKTIAWGMARGTVADKEGNDIRKASALKDYASEDIEDHRETMYREAKEELGLIPEEIVGRSIHDHGLHDYMSETQDKGTYPIHLFSFRVHDVPLDRLKERAADHSTDLGWKSLAEIGEMVRAGTFKSGYVPILESVERFITHSQASLSKTGFSR